MDIGKKYWWIAGLAGCIGVVTTLSVPYFICKALNAGVPGQPEIALPVLLVASIVGLAASLSIAAIVFWAIDKSDSDQALSLPKGSVRALIALGLLLIFAIMSTFLFWHIREGKVVPEAIRFAEQILTTVSTLVIAVAGFYFGTRSVEAARRAVEMPTLRRLNPPSPTKLARAKGTKLPTPIRLEAMPRGEAVTWRIVKGDDDDGSLLQTKPYEFEYTRGSSPASTVTLEFALANHPGVTAELKVETEKEPSGP